MTRRRGFTLVEMAFAAALGLGVLLVTLTVQQRVALTADSSQRKLTAAGATHAVHERLCQLVKNARRVVVPPAGSALVRDFAGRLPARAPVLLCADGSEVFFDPAIPMLYWNGEPDWNARLAAVHLETVGAELRFTLAADASAQHSTGGFDPSSEQSAVQGRVFLWPQADAERFVDYPIEPHDWCLDGDAICYGVAAR